MKAYTPALPAFPALDVCDVIRPLPRVRPVYLPPRAPRRKQGAVALAEQAFYSLLLPLTLVMMGSFLWQVTR